MALDTAKATVILRTLTKKFDNRLTAATPFYPRICTVVPSDGYDEAYGILGNMPGMREWLGDRVFNELRSGTYTLTNKHWEDSVLIKKTDIADDRMAMYGPLIEQLAIESAYHPDELVFDLVMAGDATACFDNQFFFDTDHSWGDSGSQSNDLTYNATDPDAVTAAEFKAAYHAALVAMIQFKNDQGKYLNRPVHTGLKNLLVVIPPQQWEAATTALRANLTGGGDSNVILEMPELVTSPHLAANPREFYVFNLGGVIKPFIFQAREPLSRQTKGLDDIETKDVKFMTEARYNAGYGAWWTGVMTTFT